MHTLEHQSAWQAAQPHLISIALFEGKGATANELIIVLGQGRQVLVRLARMASALPPRGLPTSSKFLRFSTTASFLAAVIVDGQSASKQNTFNSCHWLRP